jgi:ABC-2 type transport system permease protein
LLLVPLFLLILFGYAVSMDIESLTVGILDGDRTPESRRLAELMRAPDLFEQADDVLEVPRGRRSRPGGGTNGCGDRDISRIWKSISGRWTAVRPSSRRRVQCYCCHDGSECHRGGSLRFESTITTGNADTSITGIDTRRPVDFRPRIWFNPELRSTVFLVPGLISFIMVITAVISTALSVVREKEKGTMEMLEAAPLQPVVLILGKTIPYMAISLGETVLILIAGRQLFGVVVQGSYPALALVTVLFLLSCLGMGLFISTIANSQQVAFLIATVVTVLPSFILSGFVFPIRNMPLPIRLVTLIIPGRYFLSAERALMIRGAGFSAIWKECAALALLLGLPAGCQQPTPGTREGQEMIGHMIRKSSDSSSGTGACFPSSLSHRCCSFFFLGTRRIWTLRTCLCSSVIWIVHPRAGLWRLNSSLQAISCPRERSLPNQRLQRKWKSGALRPPSSFRRLRPGCGIGDTADRVLHRRTDPIPPPHPLP